MLDEHPIKSFRPQPSKNEHNYTNQSYLSSDRHDKVKTSTILETANERGDADAGADAEADAEADAGAESNADEIGDDHIDGNGSNATATSLMDNFEKSSEAPENIGHESRSKSRSAQSHSRSVNLKDLFERSQELKTEKGLQSKLISNLRETYDIDTSITTLVTAFTENCATLLSIVDTQVHSRH